MSALVAAAKSIRNATASLPDRIRVGNFLGTFGVSVVTPMKLILAFLAVVVLSPAALLHDALGAFERGEATAYTPDDAALFEELGFEEGEQAEYRTASGLSVKLRAWQFYDDTGAFAAYQWLKPAAATEVVRGERAVQKGNYTLIHFGNYLLELTGSLPDDEDIELGLAYLPRPKLTSDPPVLQYVPRESLVADSVRYVLGPNSLQKVAPMLPPSVVGFHFGTEGHYATYKTPEGELRMMILSYPSAQIARGQIDAFYDVENIVAKRDGPLILVVLEPSSPDEAQRLLASIRYRADVTMNHQPPERYDNLSNIVLDSFMLCGILACLMILGGVLVAVARKLAGKVAPESIFASAGAELQRLNIEPPDRNAR